VGIVGAGFAARHARAFATEAASEVVGVCATSVASAERVVAQSGGRAYSDVDEMLGVEAPDIVVVAVPNDRHHPIAMSALRAGAEVICEKPLALNVAQAEEMTAYAAELDRRTAMSFTWRYLPGCIALKELIDSGALGSIYHVDVRYVTRGFGEIDGPMRWQYDRARAGSGASANLGVHVIDLLHWWLGDFRSVSSLARTVVPERATDDGGSARVTVDDVCTALYELLDGTPVTLSVGWVAHVARVGLDVEIHGSAASVWLRFASNEPATATGQLLYCDDGMAAPAPRAGAVEATEDWSDLGQACVNRLVADFLRIPDGHRHAPPDFTDGLRAQCVLEATLLAGRERRWQDVDYARDAGPRLWQEGAGA
jgi:predicted dehydrogenase